MHAHVRAMAEECVDLESGAEEIVARESFSEEESVIDIIRDCQPDEPPSAGAAEDEVEEPQFNNRDTELSAGEDSMCDMEEDMNAEQEPEKIVDCVEIFAKALHQKPWQDQDILVSRTDNAHR